MLNRTRKAFTMLELIVVIVILGILAAIAIPTFAKVIERTRLNSVQRTAESLGREAVALAAFEDRAVNEADFVNAQTDLAADASRTITAGAPTVDSADAGTVVDDEPVTTFTVVRTQGGKTYTVTGSVAGSVVTTTGAVTNS